MKTGKHIRIPQLPASLKGWAAWIFLWALIPMTQPVWAQADSTAAEAPAEEVEEVEEVELLKSRTSLAVSQLPDGTIELEALLRARVDRSYQKVQGATITFYQLTEEGEEVQLKEVVTGPDGVAGLTLAADAITRSSDGTVNFLARFAGDAQTEESETDLLVQPARLVMETVEEDSSYTLSLQALASGPEGDMPIVEATVSVYVERMFSDLKVAEGETDEEGMVELAFPYGLSGDQDGNIRIRAIIEETDEYGNLVAEQTLAWGQPVSYAIEALPRTLWSPNPPTWMVVAFFVLMGTVWIHYMIIIWKLFRIKGQKTAS